MSPTKYPSLSEINAPRPLSVGLVMPSCVFLDDAGGELGREAPLDLIEEHLTEEIGESQFRQGTHGGVLLRNWFFPSSYKGISDENPTRLVTKIQSFAHGGYEATCRRLDLQKIGRAIEFGGNRGKREKPDEISQLNLEKAAQRAKRSMRLLIKNMMADHLVTFTKNEGPNTHGWSKSDFKEWRTIGRPLWEQENGAFWGPDDWAAAWDRFRRLMVRVVGDFPYVAILEKHEKGNYHLHVAWVGRVNVGLVRKMWLAAIGGGKGSGNIDAKLIRVPYGYNRASRIARYLTKYVGKHFEADPRFNKKRYWASRQTLEDARRYVFEADTVDGALFEMAQLFGIDPARVVKLFRNPDRGTLFLFPDNSGFFYNHDPDAHSVDPPF